MMYRLSNRSWSRIEGVNPRLIGIACSAIYCPHCPVDFTVPQDGGRRTLARQKELKAKGVSRTLKSRHITGHAIDLIPIINGRIPWNEHFDPKPWADLSSHILEVAKRHGVPIEWGGNWSKGWDKPHYQLPRKQFPA